MQIMSTNRAVAESYLPHETRQVSPVWPMNGNLAIEDLSAGALCDVFHYELVSLISYNACLADVPVTSAHFQLGLAIECVLDQCSANVLCVGKGIHEVEVHLEPGQQETFNLLFPWMVEATLEFNAQSKNEPNNPTLRIKLNGNLNDSYDLFVEKRVIDGKNEIWLTCLNKNADPETETKMLMFLARPEQFDEPIDSDEVVFCDEPIDFHVQTSLLTTRDQPIAEKSRSVQIPQLPLQGSVPTVKSNPSFIDLSCDENEQAALRNFLNAPRLPVEREIADPSVALEKKRLALFNLVLNKGKVVSDKKTQEKEIKALLDETPKLIHAKTKEDHNSLLHIAAANGHESICLLLLGKGHETNPVNKLGETPYQRATTHSIKQLLVTHHKEALCKDYPDFSQVEVKGRNEFQKFLRLKGVSDADVTATFSKSSFFGISDSANFREGVIVIRARFREDVFMTPHYGPLCVFEEYIRMQQHVQSNYGAINSKQNTIIFFELVKKGFKDFLFLNDRLEKKDRPDIAEAKKLFYCFGITPLFQYFSNPTDLDKQFLIKNVPDYQTIIEKAQELKTMYEEIKLEVGKEIISKYLS